MSRLINLALKSKSKIAVMAKLPRINTVIGLGLLLLLGTNQQIVAQPAQPSVNRSVTMNSAESELITTIKTACKALSLQSDNPAAIANQFGKVIDVSLENSQTVKPFNQNYQEIYIGTDGSLPAPPYPAYVVKIIISPKVSLSSQAIRQALGESRNLPPVFLDSPYLVAFRPIFPELPNFPCNVFVHSWRDKAETEDGTVIRVNIRGD
jgi:hypothetical protein